MFCLLQQKTIHEHKLTLQENDPWDFIDIYLLQIEATNADENSTFTGIYFPVLNCIQYYVLYGI
jgi:hypothetical protein